MVALISIIQMGAEFKRTDLLNQLLCHCDYKKYNSFKEMLNTNNGRASKMIWCKKNRKG
jgi:hypothetical protein